MHRDLGTTTNTAVPLVTNADTAGVRLLYENPSADFGWSYCFGVRESFARTYNRFVSVDQHTVERGEPGSFVEVVSAFFDRADRLREDLEGGVCVYWVVLKITIPRDDGEATLMPAMACSAFTSKRILACKFDTLLREPDAKESTQLAYCATNAANVMPVANGSREECERARSLIKTVHTGLMIGYELAFPDIIDPRLRKKPN